MTIRIALSRGTGPSLALAIATGCALLTGPDAPAACGFPERTPLAYAGESSLVALDLADGRTTFDDAVGQIYVTQDPVPFTGSIPITPNGPANVPDFRQYCAIYRDATSLGGVPDGWRPPPLP